MDEGIDGSKIVESIRSGDDAVKDDGVEEDCGSCGSCGRRVGGLQPKRTSLRMVLHCNVKIS